VSVRRRSALLVAVVATAALAAASSAQAQPEPTERAPGLGGPVPPPSSTSWDVWAADRVLDDLTRCAGSDMLPAHVSACARRLLVERREAVARRWADLGAVERRIQARRSVREAAASGRERAARQAAAEEAALARAVGDGELADLLGAT
jgi:hypothetical protein